MRKILVALAFLCAPSLGVGAAWAIDCSGEFLVGKAPTIALTRAAETRQLCFTAFGLLHSGITRTPLWSAEHLTAQEIRAARTIARKDAFHEERALPDDQRADLSDYVHSGYDRGHMTPSGDMPDANAQRESFSLANMAPQAPSLNRGLWEEIEETARDLAVDDGEVYVVTGPIFAAGGAALNGRVAVPTGFYKAIYDPLRKQAGVYIVNNTPDSGYQLISVSRLRELTGIDAFPALPEGVKSRTMNLPKPTRRRNVATEPAVSGAG
jgi:endonuclease G